MSFRQRFFLDSLFVFLFLFFVFLFLFFCFFVFFQMETAYDSILTYLNLKIRILTCPYSLKLSITSRRLTCSRLHVEFIDYVALPLRAPEMLSSLRFPYLKCTLLFLSEG